MIYSTFELAHVFTVNDNNDSSFVLTSLELQWAILEIVVHDNRSRLIQKQTNQNHANYVVVVFFDQRLRQILIKFVIYTRKI